MDEIAVKIQTLTEEFLRRMGIAFDKVLVSPRDASTLRVNILSQDASLLIGHFGDTLKAMQYLLKSAISTMDLTDAPLFLILDVEGYKERQEEKVIEMAEKAVTSLLSGKSEEEHLLPMSPYFRKVVHMHLMEKHGSSGILTKSEGEGEDRHIVVRVGS